MINETSMLRYLQVFLGARFMLESKEYYLDIIQDITLPTFSLFYPNYIRGILITEKDAIRSYNPTTRKTGIFKYKIPNFDQKVEILDIADFYHPFNDRSSSLLTYLPYTAGNMVSSLAATKVLSAVPHVNSVYTVTFEPPDIVVIQPVPDRHVDFTIDIKVVRQLNQIMPTYRDDFMKLALLDVKIALYNKYINARNSGSYGGIEIESGLDEFSDAQGDRESLLDIFREDCYKHYNNIYTQLGKMVF